MGMLEKIGKALQGKKSYIVSIVFLILAAFKVFGIDIPGFVYPLLGALGIGGLRSAIGKIEVPKSVGPTS